MRVGELISHLQNHDSAAEVFIRISDPNTRLDGEDDPVDADDLIEEEIPIIDGRSIMAGPEGVTILGDFDRNRGL